MLIVVLSMLSFALLLLFKHLGYKIKSKTNSEFTVIYSTHIAISSDTQQAYDQCQAQTYRAQYSTVNQHQHYTIADLAN